MRPTTSIKAACLVCSEIFKVRPSTLHQGKGKFCSRSCAYKGRKPRVTGFKDYGYCFKKGTIPWNKGKKRPEIAGPNNYQWRGESVGYDALHDWVNRQLGKAQHCSFNVRHISTRYHWANVSGSYSRELGDWIQLCPKCHKQYDKMLHHPMSNIFKHSKERFTERLG